MNVIATIPIEDQAGPTTTGTVRIPRVSIGLFASTPAVREAMGAAAEDRRLARAALCVEDGGITGAMSACAAGRGFDLLVVEAPDDPSHMFSELDRLSRECTRGTKVIVVGKTNDVALYRNLLSAGVSDYLVKPLRVSALVAGIARTYAAPEDVPAARVVSFMGARGGAGSSTVCHNVAAATGSTPTGRVFLVDLDLDFGTAGLDFNIDSPQGAREVLAAVDMLDEAMVERMSVQRSVGLHILPAMARPQGPAVAGSDVERFLDVASESGGTLMLDLPNRWDSTTEAALKKSDEVVIVSTPDLAGMRNCKNLAETVKRLRPNDGAPRLVLNQVGIPRRPEVKSCEFSSAVQLPLTCVIGFDAAAFGRAANNGKPLVEMAPRHPAAKELAALAAALSNKSRTGAPTTTGSFLRRLGIRR